MFESSIKQGVTFISIAFFYNLSLRFVESQKSKDFGTDSQELFPAFRYILPPLPFRQGCRCNQG